MADTPTEAFIHLVQETCEQLEARSRKGPKDPRREKIVADLNCFARERLLPLWERERDSARSPYVLSLVGLTNVGKSTLMEALLGFNVAPKKNGPATAVPVEYRHGPSWRLSVRYRAAVRHTKHEEYVDADALSVVLRKIVLDADPADIAETAWVSVCGPMEVLKDGLCMADTPGFGAAQTSGSGEQTAQRLQEFLAERVHRIYFCVSAGATWAVSGAERDFYSRVAKKCGHVVVTKWDGSPDEENEYRSRHQGLFPGAHFVFVNARKATRGESESAVRLRLLKEVIASYAAPEGRLAMCDKEVAKAWRDLPDYMDCVHGLHGIPWRQDSLRQFAAACRNRAGLAEVTIGVDALREVRLH